jgi:hypothetical protein
MREFKINRITDLKGVIGEGLYLGVSFLKAVTFQR